jgi:hypothetical protein
MTANETKLREALSACLYEITTLVPYLTGAYQKNMRECGLMAKRVLRETSDDTTAEGEPTT